MARQKTQMWVPKSVRKIQIIIAFFIDTHPAGLAVLSGLYPYPTPTEIHEMIMFSRPHFDLGIAVQGGKTIYEGQRNVEALETESHFFDILEQHGGRERLANVIKEYAVAYPENYKILEDIGNIGKPNNLSLEAIAGKNNMDTKTLRNLREKIIEEIAMGVVFYGEEFRLI